MRSGELNPARRLSADFLRALGWACPAQFVLVGVWLAVPHPHTAHELALILVTLAGVPMYLPLLILARPPATMSRRTMFAAALVGVAQMTAMTWAGGGVASGFELQILWFVPIMVCLLSVRQVAVVVGLAVAGAMFVQWLTHQSFSAGDRFAGPAALLLATVLINTFEVAYVFRQLRELSELFRAQSRSDALTGLGNRAELAACAEEQTAGARGAGYVIDIDGFKLVNDAAGHHAGDQLLELLASRLRTHARTGDLLAALWRGRVRADRPRYR